MNDELLPPDAGVADSPRIAWMKAHGITTHDRGDDCFFGPDSRWLAWRAEDKTRALEECSSYLCPQAATEEEALYALALGLGLKLWNEEKPALQ